MLKATAAKALAIAAAISLIACVPASPPTSASGPGEHSSASAEGEPDLSEIRDYLRAWETRGGSGSILIARKDQILIEEGYGLADRASGRAITRETIFDIGSLVKLFTAAAILQLESRGQASQSDRLEKYFENVPPDKRGITIGQILAHRAGLADIVDANGRPLEFAPEIDFLPFTRDQLVEGIFTAPLVGKPGEGEHYSNFGYGLLGVIVEKVSGLSYEDYVRRHIFVPADMHDTGYLDPPRTRQEMAIGYQGADAWGTPLDFTAPDGPSWILKASGGMLSSPRDMLLFVQALQDGHILDPEPFERFLTLHQSVSPSGKPYVIAFGSNNIYWAGLYWDRANDIVAIVYTSDSEHTANEVMQALVRLL